MKRKRGKIIPVIIVLLLLGFLGIEMKPAAVTSSTVYTTAGQTEVKMYVIVNSFLQIDQEKLAEEILSEHWKINGKRKNESDTLLLYRTKFHYRRNLKCGTIFCDKNGEIINQGL